MSLLRPRSQRLLIRCSSRNFSTSTAARASSLQIDRNNAEAVADTVPAYPYGPARWYKQSNKGLYGGQRIQFGNNVSGDFNTKTRRTFQVNVVSKRLWSHALGRFVQLRVTARTLRTIDRVGGLDEYLLGDKEARIKQLGVSGWWLRWAIMQQPSVKKRFSKERKSLGLSGAARVESELEASKDRNVGADMEEAYAALPEEDDVDAAELAAEEELAAEHELEPELELEKELEQEQDFEERPAAAVVTESGSPDDALVVETPPDLPPLKFRVGPRAHIRLTPNGWVRTKPYAPEHAKQTIARRCFPNYVQERMAEFEAEFAKTKQQMPELSLQEEKEILKAARRQFSKEVDAKADTTFETLRMNAEERQSQRERRRTKERAKKEAWRQRKWGEGVGEPDAFDKARVA